jgi:hypothetical protein
MLPLDDSLWKKLDDAHRDRDIPALLSGLVEAWNDETANSLFWDCLCHQETCYGATYAAIPHLLKIAEPDANQRQRLQIALFSGFVTCCAFDPARSLNGGIGDESLPGLPRTIEGWDRKLDAFRGLLASFENPKRPTSQYEQAELLPRCRKVLATEPVHTHDLERIEAIGAEFLSIVPLIRAVCQRALLENLQDEFAVQYLLSGIASADGLLGLARLLHDGVDGWCRCSSCNEVHRYILFGARVAIYSNDENAARDFDDGAPSRSDGFVVPAGNGEASDTRVAASQTRS